MSDPHAVQPAEPRATHLQWHAKLLWRLLEPHLPGLSVDVLAQAESTNSLLLDRARTGSGRHDAPITTPGELQALRASGAPPREERGPYGRRSGDTHPALLVAEHQTHGRGRQGRPWQAGPGASLTFSLSLPLAPRDWSGLSLAVGVALADALEPPEPERKPRLLLKWPNDLWLADATAKPGRGRKLGGVLIETVAVGEQRMVVVGVGLNIAPLDTAAQREFAHGFASLQELDAAATAPAVLHCIALPLVKALRQFEREGFAGFAAAYARRDLLLGQTVTTVVPSASSEAPLDGVVEGVTASGALRLRVGAALHLISSGEVGVRIAAADAGPAATRDGAV